MRALGIVLPALLAGCLPPHVQRDMPSMCRLARDVPAGDITLPDLVELTSQFPRAHHYALQAYDLRNATWIMTAFGAAGLVGSFVTGFAADVTTNEVRAALGGTIGVTIALGLGATIAGAYAGKSRRNAAVALREEADAYCPQFEALPLPPPPPPPDGPTLITPPGPPQVPPAPQVPPGAQLN